MTVTLHPIVKEIAQKLELEAGRVVMSDGDLARHRASVMRLSGADDKREVLLSLVALASRLMRENKDGTSQAVERLTELAAGLIGDPEAARAVMARARP
jgi:hypothetical protein